MNPLNQIQPLINWETIFPDPTKPMELEIGMGRAHYLFERALAKPEHNIVGIEYKKTHVTKANEKKVREKITNLHAIYGNAWLLVPEQFKAESLSNISVSFPDPWWKKRHHKRRVLNPDFLNILVSKLKPQGTFFLQTDVSDLFDSYLEMLQAIPNLANADHSSPLQLENPMNARTHREKKCAEFGIPVYRAFFTKI